eukprot:TRINITY_DN62993_c0_g1_i1.p1 TRINITY_DN62993_c0_g1~~TRINITY_DN62993_c0_g1_i1.p1  ORF type:complete len:236 (+),score=26.19 TRINITY_DN62993_c0_g1_i1:70-708(+)
MAARAVTPVDSLRMAQAPRGLLASAGSNMMPSTPRTPATPRSQVFSIHDDDQRAMTACPGNTSRPLAGRLGAVCPGSQYWAPHGGPFSYRQEDTISSTRGCYTKQAVRPPFIDARDPTTTSFGHGSGTGFCPNTTSIRGVDWAHKDTADVFRTTYNDTLNTGFGLPRTPHEPAETCSSAVMSAREWRKQDARLGASMGGASTGDFTASHPHF